MRMNRKAALAAGASFGMAFLAACSDSPVAPAAPVASVPNFAVGDAATTTPVPGKLIVCKAGNTGGDFTVTRSSGSGSFDSDGLHLNPGQCVVVAEDNSGQGSGSVFQVHETGAPNVTFSVTAASVEIGFPPTDLGTVSDGANFFINSIHGIRLTYQNTFTPPPGDQGCTPGYWKQDQHFDSYPAGITPNTTFTSIFGVGGALTFLEALDLNGGGTNALWRHGAAAYLNALSNSVDYVYTTAQVIAIVNGTGAYAGLSVEERKDLLDAANNGVGGCPLN
jgi:hypothetical protein